MSFGTLPKVLKGPSSDELTSKTKIYDLQKYCIKFGEPKRTQTVRGQTTKDNMGANPAFVYESIEPDQDFDLMQMYSESSQTGAVENAPPETFQNSVLIDANVVVPLDSSFCPLNANGSAFFLLITEKEFCKEDENITGTVYTESLLMPCTFIKAPSFIILSEALIDFLVGSYSAIFIFATVFVLDFFLLTML